MLIGATVEMIARDGTKAAAVCDQLRHGTTSAQVGYVVADTGDLDAVRKASVELSGRHGAIHALIHNAGALDKQYGQSPQGIEHTVASQVLGPFLLTGLLLPQLRAAPRSPVLWVSSGGMYSQPLSVAGLRMGPDDYDGTVAYRASQTRSSHARPDVGRVPTSRPHRRACNAPRLGRHARRTTILTDLPTPYCTAPTQSRSGRRHPRVARRRRPHTDRDDRILLARSTTPRDTPRVGNTQIRHRGRTAPPLGLVPCSFRNSQRDRGVVRIAIIGTGVSGLVAAHALHRDHEVTVYEADTRVGGHANTVDVEVGGIIHAVDTGFIVYNEPNYPGFTALLRELGVETQPTEMSFSVTNAASGLEYRGSNLNTLFAQRRNLTRPSFLRLVTEIVRFNRAARRLVVNEPRWQASERLPATGGDDGTSDESIESFLRRGRYSQSFVEQFLVPFGSAIWSADPSTFTRFPMRSYARFMHNHGLLGLPGRTQWRTISGGSRQYVDRLVAPFADRIRLATTVHKVVADPSDRAASTVEVLTDCGPERFDRVIIAAHSDQALEMLADPSPSEQAVLGSISYQPNTATLHTDDAHSYRPVSLPAPAGTIGSIPTVVVQP